jgi:hypothetical protein
MLTLSATCFAIAAANKAGTLRLVERVGRVGPYVSIEDEVGVIEVAADLAEAGERVASVLSWSADRFAEARGFAQREVARLA